jgi:hypothetical protein
MLQHQDSVHMFEQDACFVYAILSILVTMGYRRRPSRLQNKITSRPEDTLSPNTIHQRIVTARLFYDFCIFRGYRRDKTNPLPRGNPGYGGRFLNEG